MDDHENCCGYQAKRYRWPGDDYTPKMDDGYNPAPAKPTLMERAGTGERLALWFLCLFVMPGLVGGAIGHAYGWWGLLVMIPAAFLMGQGYTRIIEQY